MKKTKILALFLILSFLAGGFPLMGNTAPAASYTWQDKLKRGAINIVTSPVEVARDIHNTTQEKNLLVGWTIGFVKGLGEGFLRFAAGVADLFTFPFDFPESGKGPLIDPEYVWQKPGPRYI